MPPTVDPAAAPTTIARDIVNWVCGDHPPTPAKVTFLFNMWIGRLEIIPVLVLLRGVLERLDLYR